MTIIHISSSLGGGGAEQMVLQLAKSSAPEFKTIVLSVSNDNTLLPKFEAHHIECHFLDISSFKNASLKHGLEKMHHLLKGHENLVFHCHQFHAVVLGMLYRLFYRRTPILFTLHSSTIEKQGRKTVLFLTKKLRDKDIVFSNNAKQWYLKNSAVIPNGVDFEELSMDVPRTAPSKNPFVFLFLGRLSDEKNPLYMISAAKHLLKEGITDFKFEVVGEGQLMDRLTAAIHAEQLENHFNLVGFQSNIKPYLKSANALILPSKWEGMPMVLIEAAAAKLPIIATPVGSIPDFLNSENAYVSVIEEFHKAMIDCVKHYAEALNKAEHLYHQTKATYHIDTVYQAHLNLYKSTS